VKKKLFILFFIALLKLLPITLAIGEVKIVRKLPKSAQNTVEATWSKPTPKPKPITTTRKTQFSGRLSIGGSGGMNTIGEQLYDWFSDSHFLLIQPLGNMGNLNFTGKAFRKNTLNGMNQNYLAKLNLSLDRLRFSSGIKYTEKQKLTDQLSTDDISTLIDASISMNYIESLPISLSYTHKIIQKKEGTNNSITTTGDNFGDVATLKALGDLGGFNLNLTSNFNNLVDNAKGMINTGFAGSLSVVSPLLSFVKIEVLLSPTASTVRYTETQNETSSTTLESGIGLIFPLTGGITLTTRGGRFDSWITQSGPNTGEYTPYISGWKASTEMNYKNNGGLSAKTEYKLRTTEDSFNHQASISGGYHPESKSSTEKRWLKKLTANGTLNQQYNNTWELDNNKLTWGTDIIISPTDKISLSGKYIGSMMGINEYDWANTFSTLFKHQPDPMLLYGITAGLKNLLYANGTNSVTQNYSASLTLTPQWNLKVYTFGIGENLSLTNSQNQNTASVLRSSSKSILSKLSYEMGIPILSFLQTRYHLTWEWLSTETTETTNTTSTSGNNFQHIFGITVSGNPIPFSLTTTYSLSHGTRGTRHDVNSTLNLPFGKSFSLEGRFSMSYYTDNGAEKLPFLAGLNLAYQF